ncbi:MAG: GAF domain-containing protein [Rhizobiaceae bacterium]
MEFEIKSANNEPTAVLQGLVRGLPLMRTIQDVAALVVRTTRELTSADGATVVLREGDLCHYLEEDAVSELWKGQRFPASSCISGWCIQTGKPAVIPDVFADERIPQDVYRATFVRGMGMVPVGNGKAIAALGAYWGEGRQIDVKVVEQLVAVSSILSPHLPSSDATH